VFHGNRLTRQHRGAPTESRRQGNLCIALDAQGVTDDLVEGAVKIAAPEQYFLGNGQFFLELFPVWGAHAGNIGRHLRVGLQ